MKVIGVSITLCTILTLSRAVPLNITLQTGSCDSARQKCNSSLIGSFCPQCDSNGNYLPEQCSSSTGYCWCVDVFSGKTLPNTTMPPTQQLTCGLCKTEQQNCSKLLPGSFCPHCDSNGNFLPEQCSGSTGYCWCVDVFSGKTLPNTTMPPGHQPNCGGKRNQPEPTPACVNCDNATDHTEEPNHDEEPGPPCVDCDTEEEKQPKEPESECDDCSNASKSSEEEDESTEPDSECDGCSSESEESHHDCPHGWSRFKDHCYIFISTPKTWVDAEVYCQFDGANLASVHCDQGNHFIMSLTRGDTHNFPQSWLGGFDSIHPGYWMWSDGSDFDYNNWAQNVHDDGDNDQNKNCLRMNYEYDLKWFPTSCRDPLPFVCAKSISAPPDPPRDHE